MAGETEEPFTLSLKVDSFFSGSISFGRFENESLSWEKRSAFTHNRYIEEVEKCSKPGSVIEKKAYFEAHFKKMALLRKISSESKNCSEHQASGGDVSETGGYRSESQHANELGQFDQYDGSGSENAEHRKDFRHINEASRYYPEKDGSQLMYSNEGHYYSQYHESPEGSEYDGKFIECERSVCDGLLADSQEETPLNNAGLLLDRVPEDFNAGKTHKTETGSHDICLDNDEQVIEVSENLNDSRDITVVSSKPHDPSGESITVEYLDKTSTDHQKNISPELRDATESKSAGFRSSSQIHGRIQKNVPRDAPKLSAKNLNGGVKGNSVRSKLDIHLLQTTSPARHSLHIFSEKAYTGSSNSRSDLETKRSDKKVREYKQVESQPFTPNKIEHRRHPTSNRLDKNVHATKSDKTPSGTDFNIKGSKRAERKKEFCMKLEEKMHAKEAKINLLQARTQAKREAEVKQFRKSLNFKATPLPSFYRGVERVVSHNKPESHDRKPEKGRNRSAKVSDVASLPFISNAENEKVLTSTQLANKNELRETSEASDFHITEAGTTSSSVLSSDGNSCPKALKENGGNEKKEREEKDNKLQRNRVSDRSKVTKDQRVEGNPKVGARRSSNETVKKSLKGVAVGNRSGLGHVAVGVAS